MLDNSYFEHLVRVEPTIKNIILKALYISGSATVLVLLALLSYVYIPFFAAIIIVGGGYLIFFGYRYLNVEYEYIFTGSELDIDKILAKSSRKRMMTIDVINFEVFGPVTDNNRSRYMRADLPKVRDFSSGAPTNCWFIVANAENAGRVVVLMTIDEAGRIMDVVRKYNKNCIIE